MSDSQKLNTETILKKIKHHEYQKMGKKTVVCVLTLTNGFEIVGSSGCVNETDFSQKIGEQIAYQRAFDKIWELEGYLLQNK